MAVGTSKSSKDDDKNENKVEKVEPTPARDTVLADSAEAHKDRVAMVSRDKNGNPDQSDDYELLVDDDAPADVKRRAENRPEDHRVD